MHIQSLVHLYANYIIFLSQRGRGREKERKERERERSLLLMLSSHAIFFQFSLNSLPLTFGEVLFLSFSLYFSVSSGTLLEVFLFVVTNHSFLSSGVELISLKDERNRKKRKKQRKKRKIKRENFPRLKKIQ